MANNYATIPAIIPGNLVVAGNLTVQGDELKVGAAFPYARIFKVNAGRGGLSVNLQKDLVTRDDVSKAGYALNYDCAAPGNASTQMENIAGISFGTAQRIVLASRSVPVIGTGAGGDLAVISSLVRGNAIGANGILTLRVWGWFQTIAAGGITFNGSFGGIGIPGPSIAASVTTVFEACYFVANTNSAVSNRMMSAAYGSNIVNTQATVTATVDTTADQFIALTTHFLQATDQGAVLGCEVAVVNSRGPVG